MIVNEVAILTDIIIVEGHRTKERQNFLKSQGFSKKAWPDSRHNEWPSRAVDMVPKNKVYKSSPEQWAYMAGMMKGIGHVMGETVIWGGDWDNDGETSDEKWRDKAHFELVED